MFSISRSLEPRNARSGPDPSRITHFPRVSAPPCLILSRVLRNLRDHQKDSMRSIPSIEQLRQRPAMLALEARYGRSAIVDALRAEAAALRHAADGAGADDVVGTIERAATVRLESH